MVVPCPGYPACLHDGSEVVAKFGEVGHHHEEFVVAGTPHRADHRLRENGGLAGTAEAIMALIVVERDGAAKQMMLKEGGHPNGVGHIVV